jgi:major vault protein
MSDQRRNTDLVLPLGKYAYVQDTTNGGVLVHSGPTVVTTRSVIPVETDIAARDSILVEKGAYAILENPASNNGSFPTQGKKISCPPLDMGRRVVIPGPAAFVPWPHQHIDLVAGHQLRSNQYALTRVYDAEAAQEFWDTAVMKPASPADTAKAEAAAKEATAAGEDAPEVETLASVDVEQLSEGQLILIKGTETSYYIPPTGIEVVADRHGNYVRDAVTLERLEYCILVDESGDKSFIRGPKVVFPLPTQRFHSEGSDTDGNSIRIFQPIELNDIQGVHLKFIADFKDGKGLYGKKNREFASGEEVFITGKDTTIFFPTEHVSFVKYDGKAKHYAVAVPVGEARYVMNRTSGKIVMVKGPAMLLPNPVEEVIVRRTLSQKQCALWYPGNGEVAEYNAALTRAGKGSPSTRAGTISEGQASRSKKIRRHSSGGRIDQMVGNHSSVSYGAGGSAGEEFSRGSTFTEPRTVTFGAAISGVPLIKPWTGYAVSIVNKKGDRRVVVGPAAVLLEYDEELEFFSLSTGKPKTSDNMITDSYLRVASNQVSDLVTVETSDHVQVRVKLSLRSEFTGDSKVWFAVDNYVKLMTDRVRSMLRAAVRGEKIESFFAHGEEFIRDTILGKKEKAKKEGEEPSRKGLLFAENGLHVKDVEVLDIQILDRAINDELRASSQEAVTLHLGLERARRSLDAAIEREGLQQQQMASLDKTESLKAELELRTVTRVATKMKAQQEAAKQEHEQQLAIQTAADGVADIRNASNLKRQKAMTDQEMSFKHAKQTLELGLLQAQTAAFTSKAEAVSGDISQAIMALGDKQTVVQLAQALKVQTALDGGDFGGSLATVLGGTKIGKAVLAQLQAPSNGA